jgi:F-type H+-transporting ATPase subunit alpha
VSAYIPTNVISITDGQIYLESDLFYSGVRPAINVGISVSRVGGSAQIKAMKKVAGTLRLDLAQYRAMAAFAQFASDLDKATQNQLSRGERLTELLKQGQFEPVPVEEQVLAIYAGSKGRLDPIPVSEVKRYEAELIEYVKSEHPKVLEMIRDRKKLDDEVTSALDKALESFAQIFDPDKKS